jgi:hypothetical protein
MNSLKSVNEWSGDQLLGIRDIGLSKIWTEVDRHGRVIREIGFDVRDEPVHFGAFGMKGNFLFDGQTIVPNEEEVPTNDSGLREDLRESGPIMSHPGES